MSLEQIFCNHAWKKIADEYLRTEREKVAQNYYQNYTHYLVRYWCVKCGKTKRVEEKYWELY